MCTYHNSEERYEKDEYFAKRKNGFFSGELLQRGGFSLNYVKLNSRGAWWQEIGPQENETRQIRPRSEAVL